MRGHGWIIAAAILALAGAACSGQPYKLPTTPDYDRSAYRELGYAEGYVVGRVLGILVPIIPVGATNTTERATLLAIKNGGGDVARGDILAEMVITEKWSWNPFSFGRGTRVRGLVLRKLEAGEPETEYERGRREERERIERESSGQETSEPGR